MNIEDIEGGVSPLKKKARQSSRGGAEAGRATAKKGGYLSGRGGYAKSRGVRGAGGRNVGGYNVHTRFQPRKTPTTPSSTTESTPQKPYAFGDDGDIVINNYMTADGGTKQQQQQQSTTTDTKTTKNGYWEEYYEYETTNVGSWDYSSGRYPTYRQAWDLNLEDITNKYTKFEDYVQDLEDQKAGKKPRPGGYKRPDYNASGSTTTKKVKKRRWVALPDSTSTTTTQQSQSQQQN